MQLNVMTGLTRGEGIEQDGGGIDGAVSVDVEHSKQSHQ